MGSFSGVGSLCGIGSLSGVGSLGGGLTCFGGCLSTGDTTLAGDGDLKPFVTDETSTRGDCGVVERGDLLVERVSVSESLRGPAALDPDSTTVLCMPVGVGLMVTLRSAWKPGLLY